MLLEGSADRGLPERAYDGRKLVPYLPFRPFVRLMNLSSLTWNSNRPQGTVWEKDESSKNSKDFQKAASVGGGHI